MKITDKTKIKEMVEQCPEAAEILMKHNLPCAQCPYGRQHSLDHVKKMHNVSDEEVEKILKEINDLDKKKE